MAPMIRPVVWLLAWAVAGAAAGGARYVRDVEDWQRERARRLTADGGWLTVAGLAWLKPGQNSFGSDPKCDVVLPAHAAPPQAGVFVLEGSQVRVEVRAGVAVTLGDKPVTRTPLKSDAGGTAPDVLSLGALTMQIIDRGGKLGVRVKDMKSPARAKFKGLRYFPIEPRYRVVARFVPHPTPVTLNIPTVLGTVESMPSPGYATFDLPEAEFLGAPQPLRLDAVLEPGETDLFFIFRDATSGKTTYGAGRFLYAAPPADGKVVLDFNRAYSPPCAFTPHATCPLPPPNNRLPVAIEAGEMYAGH
jgi:uncharacterized protein (DUF1684 family)